MPKRLQKGLVLPFNKDRVPRPKKYTLRTLPLRAIVPSPFQLRRDFDPEKLQELARSIVQDGLISPILVRPVDPSAGQRNTRTSGGRAQASRAAKHFELIAGERRFRAIRDYTDMETIEAKVIEVDDIGAQRLSAIENIQREDLSDFEIIETIVKLVDAELLADLEYASMGHDSVARVKTLLGKLDSVRSSQERGSVVAGPPRKLFHKFVEQVDQVFKNLPKPLEWRSFYIHDLNLLVQAAQEVRKVSIQHKLNKSQTWALEKLNKVSKGQFEALVQESPKPRMKGDRFNGSSARKRRLRDFSAAEIEAIVEKEIKKQALVEQRRLRETLRFISKVKALLMNRLDIPLEIIASNLGINWRTAKKYSQDNVVLKAVRESLKGGLSVPTVAKKYGFPEPLVWSVAFEDKDDQDRFEALGWKIRPWDVWYWNNCDQRFGDDWPGRIPAQMIALILYYFSDQGDLVMDPMTGGGVVPDTSLVLNRKCRSFDMESRLKVRPEIESHFWDVNNMEWPIKGNDKPDLVIFDPPYFSKKSGNYDPKAISGMSRESYLDFMKQFLSLAHQHTKPTCRLALINADWRDFQQISARDEKRENAILIREYLDILDGSGWEETHIIQAPLSSERFTGNMVNVMQKRRTLGVISRYVIMARRAD